MSATAAQHAAHLSAEQAEGDERDRWPDDVPRIAPPSIEDEEELPPWERLCDPFCRCRACRCVLYGDEPLDDLDLGHFTTTTEETR